ncbi:gamma-glutamyltransferase [Sneathiella chungangensis]|uniref:Glutathione hydrolase proenzyme n=1 Tax=Sneathiella chungangensis TaxID=1418234 RepID=A0A845MLB5_9PROT|nr:gamma-glutamyltransferase [Sneathiella chungangensis]MZR24305.1 gamma-glutamyltransferase [Sneathiella chungangensis]
MRNFYQAGRSVTYGVNGAVATSSTHSSQAALSILKSGGNAMDAAIAACAIQCVVDPMQTGIGGDCFALVAVGGGGDIEGLNGSGKAPAALSADYLMSKGINKLDPESAHSVTIPGAIVAWTRLHEKYGSMDFADLLAPAIDYAENGFPVTQRTSLDWEMGVKRLLKNKAASDLYLKGGKAPAAGSIWRLPKLAATLKAVAKKGRSAFYEGEIAEQMAETLRAVGGVHEAADFAATHADFVTPIHSEYEGHHVHQIPPNGQGITALIMLNILKRYDHDGLDPNGAMRLHLEAEAARLAYLARNKYVADPTKADVPIDMLLSDEFAEHLCGYIEVGKAGDPTGANALERHRDTVYISVVDKDRNAVSFINSLFQGFGSGIACAKTGVIFQNRGYGFVVDPDHPNCIAPGKRPMHTIIPGMVTKGGKAAISYGVMGGGYQPVGHAHVLTNIWNFGMDVQEAIDSPRAFYDAGILEVEEGIPASVRAELVGMGYELADTTMPLGGGQMIAIDPETGVLSAGSESRKDGCAIAY